ncbi:MAG: RNA polymerase sigma factor [Chitinophagaceae bacterium]
MTEHELIQGCIRQEAKYQRMLFQQYANTFMAVCQRYANSADEAEDMLQEGFIRIFRFIHQFKFEGSFEGWMRRIMVNTALKQLQKKKINFTEIKDHHADTTQQSLEPYAYSHLGANQIMELINNLPTGYRTVFNLVVIEGYSHEEVAEMLSIQPGTSRSQLVKAKKMLQNQIIALQKVAV